MRETTVEDAIDRLIDFVAAQARIAPARCDWDEFLRFSDDVHERFTVPETSYTPAMRRFVYALAAAKKPHHLVGVGTYVGYTFAWLVGGARSVNDSMRTAVAIDIDLTASVTARANFRTIAAFDGAAVLVADGLSAIRETAPIDLLYLDIDDPTERKRGYLPLLRAAERNLSPDAWVLAHDASHPYFEEQLRPYTSYIETSIQYGSHRVFRIDECGLALSIYKGS